ncbi:MAG: hypothetical protein HY514_04665 [Candidatus Aenigmarchaeota archaeon]|nr:hypothetical protein [Candidatus Aenigmarchaeota archaeon]
MKRKHNEMTEEEKRAFEKLSGKFKLVPKKNHKSTHKTIFSYTIGILKQRKYAKLSAISILAFGILYSFLYGFWQIPAVQFGFVRMAEITVIDIVYVALISVMAGLLVSLLKYKVDDASGSKLGGLGGVFAGFVSTVCPACQGITIAALGSTVAAIPLGFLVPYLWILQIITIFILGLSLYLTSNSIYTKTCISCEVPAKRSVFKLPKTNT